MGDMKLPKGWVETTIEGATIILDNKRKPVSSSERAKRLGDIPYYGATGRAGWIDDFIFNEQLVLLGEDGAPFFDKKKRVAYLIKGKSWVNNHAHVLKAKTGITSNIFLLNFLNYFDYTGFVGGTTRLKLNQGNLKKIPIPLPPLAEQKRLTAKLDKLFGHLAVLQERLAVIPGLLADFRQSVLTQAVTGKLTEEWREGKELENNIEEFRKLRQQEFSLEVKKLKNEGKRVPKLPLLELLETNELGWSIVSVESAALFIVDCLHSTPKFVNKGFYCIDTTSIKPFSIKWEKVRMVDEESFEKWISRLKPKEGDILFSREGTIGVGVKVPKDKEICIGQRMMMFRFSSGILSGFAEIYVNSFSFRDLYQPHIKGVAAQHLNIGSIRKLGFPIPSKEEQTEIVSRVQSLFTKADHIQARYQSLKEKIDTLPQAILAKAFRGELTEQLETDGDARALLAEIAKLREAVKGKKTKQKK